MNVQICWNKFANYFDVEPRPVPMEGDRLHLGAAEAATRCDENTIGVVAALREAGWLVPAYTFPENRPDVAALRIVVRYGFSHDLAGLLLDDLIRCLERLRAQPGPVRGAESAGFAHGTEHPATARS